ncbi:DUF1801 domain-containing protein [Alkalicoccus daliensis]|uniref:YdhG-like domain-containing protein n=1 Tax=Alkalicoccus daliensis TaxID=745820 RepID=A0A1H0HEV1_9BACI|nr:DUF1801 domain-containing protein [Alkalicoccus daliensis]SDO17574.1 protein of unknown function (DU1801) [Alkalicoccus daliensis]
MNEINPYLNSIDEKWKPSFQKLLQVIEQNIPEGFVLQMQYRMPSFVVPFTVYPSGYHAGKNTPLPFISVAAQKNHIAVYHMGIYADQELLQWFQGEYSRHMSTKLNMGKSCIRFTNPDKIPYELLGDLVSRVTVKEWIKMYERIS